MQFKFNPYEPVLEKAMDAIFEIKKGVRFRNALT